MRSRLSSLSVNVFLKLQQTLRVTLIWVAQLVFHLGDNKCSLHESTQPLKCPHRHASHTQSLLYSSYNSCLYEIGSPVPSPDPKEHNCGWCIACFAALGMLSPQGNHCGLWRLENQPGQDVLFILALNTFELKTWKRKDLVPLFCF